MKKYLACFLLAALLLPSCSQNAPDSTDTSAPDSTTPQVTETTAETTTDRADYKDSLPDNLNFNGQNVRVIYRSASAVANYELIGTDNSGDIIFDAVWERNRKVEDRLGIKFAYIDGGVSYQLTYDSVYASLMADSYDFDYINATSNATILRYLNPYMRDMVGAPHIDFDQPWWWTDAMESLSLQTGVWRWLFGDSMVSCYGNAGAMFFNKALYQNIHGNPDEVYQLVLDGKWTIDKLTELTTGAYKDVNGDGVKDYEDIHGYVKYGSVSDSDMFYSGFQVRTTSRNEKGVLIIDVDQERATTALEKLITLRTAPGVWFDEAAKWSADNIAKPFSEGKLLFIAARLRATDQELRDMQDPYGILPYPKLDEEQKEYKSMIHQAGTSLSVPNTVPNESMECIGATLEATMAESYRSVMPLYLESVLKLKYSQDEMSGKVIDIITAGVIKEPLHDYGGMSQYLLNNIFYFPANQDGNFASAYAANIDSSKAAWDAKVAEMEDLISQ